MTERPGDATYEGRPLTVIGDKLSVGDAAPNFELSTNIFSADTVTLTDSQGQVRLINVVPSLYTGICSRQTRRFNEEVGKYADDVVGYTVSADLPIAQSNWCEGAGVENMQMLSDYRGMQFGTAYGTHIKELHLEVRAVFIVDADDVVRYVEYIPEIGQHPDYEAALAALAKVAS